jgi:DNA-binding response OmpR family regulator
MNDDLFKGRSILLIDDDPAVRAVVKQHLELHGAKVEQADRGEEGLALARSGRLDLIVLDIVLPGIDGFAVCRSLKAVEETRQIPVIFLSAKEETRERVKGLRLGAIDYVVKPFDLDELAARIDIALRIKTDLMESAAIDAGKRPSENEKGPLPARIPLPREEFIETVEKRFKNLDPKTGLLTLAFVRADQEEAFLSAEDPAMKQVFEETLLEILTDLAPKGTLVGEIDPVQIGMLIPRKNKYGAELVLDELRNLLALRTFGNHGKEHHITISCGVAEYPSPQIESARQFEELAEFALRRAQRGGGDQTVLM